MSGALQRTSSGGEGAITDYKRLEQKVDSRGDRDVHPNYPPRITGRSRLASADRVVNASYESGTPDIEEAKATLEVQVLKAELLHRQALASPKKLMGAP